MAFLQISCCDFGRRIGARLALGSLIGVFIKSLLPQLYTCKGHGRNRSYPQLVFYMSFTGDTMFPDRWNGDVLLQQMVFENPHSCEAPESFRLSFENILSLILYFRIIFFKGKTSKQDRVSLKPPLGACRFSKTRPKAVYFCLFCLRCFIRSCKIEHPAPIPGRVRVRIGHPSCCWAKREPV